MWTRPGKNLLKAATAISHPRTSPKTTSLCHPHHPPQPQTRRRTSPSSTWAASSKRAPSALPRHQCLTPAPQPSSVAEPRIPSPRTSRTQCQPRHNPAADRERFSQTWAPTSVPPRAEARPHSPPTGRCGALLYQEAACAVERRRAFWALCSSGKRHSSRYRTRADFFPAHLRIRARLHRKWAMGGLRKPTTTMKMTELKAEDAQAREDCRTSVPFWRRIGGRTSDLRHYREEEAHEVRRTSSTADTRAWIYRTLADCLGSE